MLLLGKIKMKQKAVVLMYHRVLPSSLIEKTFSSNGIVVSEKSFEMQLTFIKQNFELVNLDSFVLFLDGKLNSTKPLCLITFDDGWLDNYDYAFPLLKRYNIPATIFLTHDFINKNEPFWQEKINRYIKTKMLEINPKNVEKFHMEILNEFTLDKKIFRYLSHSDYFIKELVQYLKSQRYEKILDIVKYCDNNGNCIDKYYPDVFMNWEQVSEMKEYGINFESHGLTHKILPNLSEKEKYAEISKSKNMIGEKLTSSVESFSFPNGDYDELCINFVKECGYRLAFTTNVGYVDTKDDRFRLNRINIHDNNSINVPLFYSTILDILN